METIQIVLDARLLHATDRAAKRRKLNRSALIRDAIREHLKTLQIRELEERDRKGYEKTPSEDFSLWEGEAAWPDA